MKIVLDNQMNTTATAKKKIKSSNHNNHVVWSPSTSSSSSSSILVLLLITLLFLTSSMKLSDSTTFIYAGCSTSKFQPNSLYQSNLNSLLSTITTSSSKSSYDTFAAGNNSGSVGGAPAVFGLFQCRNDLSTAICAACVSNAAAQIAIICPLADAASLQLDGCFLRYSGENFVGLLDTSLAFKRCDNSRAVEDDVAFFQTRDDVFDDLESTSEFRMSRAGTVEGCAECVGDLAAGDCRTCVETAVGELKEVCGSSLAGDVYLAKCYARYWTAGHYLDSPSDDSEDDIAKTVAIIIGVVTAAALLVVFVSYLRKTC